MFSGWRPCSATGFGRDSVAAQGSQRFDDHFFLSVLLLVFICCTQMNTSINNTFCVWKSCIFLILDSNNWNWWWWSAVNDFVKFIFYNEPLFSYQDVWGNYFIKVPKTAADEAFVIVCNDGSFFSKLK